MCNWFVFLDGRVSSWTSVIVRVVSVVGPNRHQMAPNPEASSCYSQQLHVCHPHLSLLLYAASLSPTDGLMPLLLTTTLMCVHMFLALWLHLAKWPLKLQPVFHPTVQLGYIKPGLSDVATYSKKA